jgi:hypothetical protein
MDQQETKHFVKSVDATPFSYLEEVVKKVTQLGSSKAH